MGTFCCFVSFLVPDTMKNTRDFLCRHVFVAFHFNSYPFAPKTFFTPCSKRRKGAEAEA